MTSVNVTTQNNTVTVQQGDATTVTVTTQGPQGPAGAAGAGLSNVVDDTSPQLGGDLASNSFDIKFADNDKALFGDSDDLQIFHDGTHSRIKDTGTGRLFIHSNDTQFLNAAGSETIAKFTEDGAVELRHNNDIKFVTSADGVNLPDNSKLQLGDSQDLQIFHDGSQSVIKDNGTGQLLISGENTVAITNAAATENYARFLNNGAVELYHNNVKRCETSADGLNLPDNSKLQLGDSQDLQIFHDSANSFIKDSGTGGLIINTDAFQVKDQSNSTFALTAVPTSFVKLFFNNSVKLETTSSGVTVTGSVTTQDINMSNLNGTANEVDNTKGSWSIQEGADDLFLINRVSGKKYKFNLTEVS